MPLRSLHLCGLILMPLVLAALLGGFPFTHPLVLSIRNASYASLVFFFASLSVPSFRRTLKHAFSSVDGYIDIEKEERRVSLLIIAFFGFVYFKATLLDYLTFHANAIDLSMYDYALMNTLEGRFFQPVDGTYSHFGVHFTPTLLLLLPLYAVFKTPLLSLFIHPLVIWIGGILLYEKILKSEVKNSLARLGILFSYFNCIWVGLVLHFHFHAEVFYIPLTFLLVDAIKNRRMGFILLYSVLYLGVKEDAPFYWMGIITASRLRKWISFRTAVVGVVIGILYAGFVLKIAIPAFSSTDYKLVAAATGYGSDPITVFQTLLSSFPQFLRGLTEGGWIKATYQWLFLPWIDPFFAVASLPFIAIHNMAFGGSMRAMHMHYSSPFIPLLFIGVAHSFSRLWSWRPQRRSQILILYAVAFLVSNLVGGGYLVFRKYNSQWKLLHRIDDAISESSSICTHPDSLPHFRYRGDRIKFYTTECLVKQTENIVLQERFSTFNAQPEQTARWIAEIRASGRYDLMLNDRGWYWFKLKVIE